VYSVASLLGELVSYRAEGCGHLEALAGIVYPSFGNFGSMCDIFKVRNAVFLSFFVIISVF